MFLIPFYDVIFEEALYNVWKEGNRDNILISILFGKNEHTARIWENNIVHPISISMEGDNR